MKEENKPKIEYVVIGICMKKECEEKAHIGVTLSTEGKSVHFQMCKKHAQEMYDETDFFDYPNKNQDKAMKTYLKSRGIKV